MVPGHVTLPSVPVSLLSQANKLECLLIYTDNTMIQLKFGPTRYCVEWTVSHLVHSFYLYLLFADIQLQAFSNIFTLIYHTHVTSSPCNFF